MKEKFKIIVLPETIGKEREYNGIVFKDLISSEKRYMLKLLENFTKSENKIYEKNFNFTLEKNLDLIVLINFLKNLSSSIKIDLYSKNIILFCIPNNEIYKLKKL